MGPVTAARLNRRLVPKQQVVSPDWASPHQPKERNPRVGLDASQVLCDPFSRRPVRA